MWQTVDVSLKDDNGLSSYERIQIDPDYIEFGGGSIGSSSVDSDSSSQKDSYISDGGGDAQSTTDKSLILRYTEHYQKTTLHWNISWDGTTIKIDFDENSLPKYSVYNEDDETLLYNPKITSIYKSYLDINKCTVKELTNLDKLFTIDYNIGEEDSDDDYFYNVKINTEKFNGNSVENVYIQIIDTGSDLTGNKIIGFLTIEDVNDAIIDFSGDLYIEVLLTYYTDTVMDIEGEIVSISGNFFSPGEVVYYIEGNYIKKIVVREIELTWEYSDGTNETKKQTSLTDIHGRTGIGEKKYIDDYKLFIDKDNLINHVTNNEERKEPEKKYFYVKYRLGDSVYSLWNDSVHYAKIIKVTYTESKSLVDYTTNIDIKYTLQDGTEEWIVSEDNVFANKSDIKTTISDELSVEDSNNLIYLGCDVCDIKN
jgi:hypothetical protein